MEDTDERADEVVRVCVCAQFAASDSAFDRRHESSVDEIARAFDQAHSRRGRDTRLVGHCSRLNSGLASLLSEENTVAEHPASPTRSSDLLTTKFHATAQFHLCDKSCRSLGCRSLKVRTTAGTRKITEPTTHITTAPALWSERGEMWNAFGSLK